MGDVKIAGSKSIMSIKSHSMGPLKSMSRMRFRKQSLGFGSVAGIRPVERSSMFGNEYKRPPLLFLSTYQLDPTKKVDKEIILKDIDAMLEESFSEHKYNAQESTGLAIRLANDIMRRIKVMSYSRYRIISVVTIGQKRSQSYNNAIAFIWDHERDVYVNTQREVNTAFIQVTVFGIYLD